MRYAPASLGARVLGVGLDVVIGGCAILITLMIWSQKSLPQIISMMNEDPANIAPIEPALTAAAVVALVLPLLFAIPVARRGTTPGKAALSLSIRNARDGALPSYARACSREFLRFIHVAPLVVPLEMRIFPVAIAILVILDMTRNPLSQTWYDRLTRIVVVAPVVEPE